MHCFEVAIKKGILIDIAPGKPAVIKYLPEILKIFQPVPIDIASLDWFVKPVDEHCGRGQRQSSQNLGEILAGNNYAGRVLVRALPGLPLTQLYTPLAEGSNLLDKD